MTEKEMILLFGGIWVGIGIAGGTIAAYRWWRDR